MCNSVYNMRVYSHLGTKPSHSIFNRLTTNFFTKPAIYKTQSKQTYTTTPHPILFPIYSQHGKHTEVMTISHTSRFLYISLYGNTPVLFSMSQSQEHRGFIPNIWWSVRNDTNSQTNTLYNQFWDIVCWLRAQDEWL